MFRTTNAVITIIISSLINTQLLFIFFYYKGIIFINMVFITEKRATKSVYIHLFI